MTSQNSICDMQVFSQTLNYTDMHSCVGEGDAWAYQFLAMYLKYEL